MGIWRLQSVKCANKPGVQAKQTVHCCRHKEGKALIVHLWRPVKIRGAINLCAAAFDQSWPQAHPTKHTLLRMYKRNEPLPVGAPFSRRRGSNYDDAWILRTKSFW